MPFWHVALQLLGAAGAAAATAAALVLFELSQLAVQKTGGYAALVFVNKQYLETAANTAVGASAVNLMSAACAASAAALLKACPHKTMFCAVAACQWTVRAALCKPKQSL